MSAENPALAEAYAAALDQVRRLDKDRFLAALFCPEPARRHVLAILAFSAEIARVRDLVSDPLPGEVRLQWWRDMLAGAARGDVAGHPIAAALGDTIARFNLPVAAFESLIDARTFDLYDDPVPSLNDLEGYCGETSSALVQLSALVLAEGRDPDTAEAAGYAGVAYGLTGLMRSIAFHAARGQVYLPLDVLGGRTSEQLRAALSELRGVARRHLADLSRVAGAIPREVRAAFLPCSLIEPMLERMDRRGYDPFRDVIDLPQWLKPWRLWRAARRGA